VKLSRVILFSEDVRALAAFYRDVIGLPLRELSKDGKWAELDAGGCALAIHAGGEREERKRPPKLVFFAASVSEAREALVARGARLGKVKGSGAIQLCEGKDPEGNAFQLSSREP
jgi:predicted enzyme related to lactoylglutathione lyase